MGVEKNDWWTEWRRKKNGSDGTGKEMEKGSQVGGTRQCSSINIMLIPHTSQGKDCTELIMSENQLSGKRENL